MTTAVPSLNLVLEPLSKDIENLKTPTGASFETVKTPSGSTEVVQSSVCSVPNCWQHKEASLLPEPIYFFDIPTDDKIRNLWNKV